jgi:hypothetical protein
MNCLHPFLISNCLDQGLPQGTTEIPGECSQMQLFRTHPHNVVPHAGRCKQTYPGKFLMSCTVTPSLSVALLPRDRDIVGKSTFADACRVSWTRAQPLLSILFARLLGWVEPIGASKTHAFAFRLAKPCTTLSLRCLLTPATQVNAGVHATDNGLIGCFILLCAHGCMQKARCKLMPRTKI